MGNDGGSIPTRRELVKSAARQPTVSELKATALEALTHSWQIDPINDEPLELDNVASDWRGKLYNYYTVLRGLSASPKEEETEKQKDADASTTASAGAEDPDKTTIVDFGLAFASTGIRSLRDVVRLHGKVVKQRSTGEKVWQCPVSLKELGPGTRAIYLVPCGHVFANEIRSSILPDKVCPVCSEPFKPSDIIPILPTEESEIAQVTQRIDTLRTKGLTHTLKKDKSHHKSKDKDGDKNGKKKHKKRKAENELEKGDENGKTHKHTREDKEKTDSNGANNGPHQPRAIKPCLSKSCPGVDVREQTVENARNHLGSSTV